MDEQDREALTKLNERIGLAENNGDSSILKSILAEQRMAWGDSVPLLAFQRANTACVDAREFLETVEAGGNRITDVESISILGQLRAVVTCVVTVGSKKYHNVRLFVRADPRKDWKLLAWANEPK